MPCEVITQLPLGDRAGGDLLSTVGPVNSPPGTKTLT